jgi:hypothetical protein
MPMVPIIGTMVVMQVLVVLPIGIGTTMLLTIIIVIMALSSRSVEWPLSGNR